MRFAPVVLLASVYVSSAAITTPKQFFGHDVGDDYYLSNYKQFSDYWRHVDKESDRAEVQSIGKTAEGRDQLMAIVTGPKNFKSLEKYRSIAQRLALAKGASWISQIS